MNSLERRPRTRNGFLESASKSKPTLPPPAAVSVRVGNSKSEAGAETSFSGDGNRGLFPLGGRLDLLRHPLDRLRSGKIDLGEVPAGEPHLQ